MKHFLTTFFSMAFLLVAGSLQAQWQPNGNLVCGAQFDQAGVQSISDGSGGAYTVWRDFRNAPNDSGDIYAQRIDANGNPMWAANGIAICSATGSQSQLSLAPVSNAAGGNDLYIVWVDKRNAPGTPLADVYAQRVSTAGTPAWTANGVRVTANSTTVADVNPPSPPQIVVTGSGEAVVTWIDVSNFNPAELPTPRIDIVAQKLSPADGQKLWITPVLVSGNFPQYKIEPHLTMIGTDIFFSWTDFRNNTVAFGGGGTPPSDADVFCQRVTTSGTTRFTAGGINITQIPLLQLSSSLAPSTNNNVIVSWLNYIDFTSAPSLLSQAVDSSGNKLWLTETTISPDVFYYIATSDTKGGLIAAYITTPDGQTVDIGMQGVAPSGIVKYGATGVTVCDADDDQVPTSIIVDSSKGIYIAWTDGRNPSNDDDVYAQRLALSDGLPLWALNGAPVTTALMAQDEGAIALSTSTGDIIVSFTSEKTDGSLDIKANRVSAAGQSTADVKLVSDARPSELSLAQNYPNPFNASTEITFALAQDDVVTLVVTDALGREVKTLLTAHLAAGSYRATCDANELSNGVYTYRLSTANGYSASRQMIVTK